MYECTNFNEMIDIFEKKKKNSLLGSQGHETSLLALLCQRDVAEAWACRGLLATGCSGGALEFRAALVYRRGDPGSQGAAICPRPCPRQPARSGPISLS